MRWMNVRRKARVSVSSLVSKNSLISSANAAIMSSESSSCRRSANVLRAVSAATTSCSLRRLCSRMRSAPDILTSHSSQLSKLDSKYRLDTRRGLTWFGARDFNSRWM